MNSDYNYIYKFTYNDNVDVYDVYDNVDNVDNDVYDDDAAARSLYSVFVADAGLSRTAEAVALRRADAEQSTHLIASVADLRGAGFAVRCRPGSRGRQSGERTLEAMIFNWEGTADESAE